MLWNIESHFNLTLACSSDAFGWHTMVHWSTSFHRTLGRHHYCIDCQQLHPSPSQTNFMDSRNWHTGGIGDHIHPQLDCCQKSSTNQSRYLQNVAQHNSRCVAHLKKHTHGTNPCRHGHHIWCIGCWCLLQHVSLSCILMYLSLTL
jgi:hypothetical protein